jgi:hypothetical protein
MHNYDRLRNPYPGRKSIAMRGKHCVFCFSLLTEGVLQT